MDASYIVRVQNGGRQLPTVSQTAKVSTVKWNLKEAEGKLPALVTRVLTPSRIPIRPRCPDEVPDQTEVRKLLRDTSGRWEEYMGGKRAPLPGEACSLLGAGVSRSRSNGDGAREGLNFRSTMEVEGLWEN